MELIFAEQRMLNFNHIDNHGIARPSAAFDLMQEIATSHGLQMGVDKDTLGVLWVLSRMHVRQMRPLYAEESLRVQTTFDGLRGINWCRVFSIFVGEEQVATARSSWVMLDPQTHHMVRPKSFAVTAELPVLGKDYEIPGKLACDTTALHHVHRVRYSDLDRNGHLNNVRIVDIIADGLEFEQMQHRFIREMQVNYLAECVCGEEIALSVGEGTDGLHYVFGQADGAVKFEAAAKIAAY